MTTRTPTLAATLQTIGDLRQHYASEKLDGVRAEWRQPGGLFTKGGLRIMAPHWFTAGLPTVPVAGEIWCGHGGFATAQKLCAAGDSQDPDWSRATFALFDLPDTPAAFAEKTKGLQLVAEQTAKAHIFAIPQRLATDQAALEHDFNRVINHGGEGIVLRRADDRRGKIVKLKARYDAEAAVVTSLPGTGNNSGRMGALLVRRLADNAEFKIGTGFSEADRDAPPAPGEVITFTYTGLTENGLPRHASFLRKRAII